MIKLTPALRKRFNITGKPFSKIRDSLQRKMRTMTPVQRHDKFQDTRPGEVYYFYDAGLFHVIKRSPDGWGIAARYADTSIESYAKDICETFKKYEEVQ